MPTPQQQLVERVSAALRADDRVRGLWLTGSLGTGRDDRFSDVDMFVAVTEDALEGYLADWPSVAERYRPLHAHRLPGAPVFNHVLPGWLRWDVVIGTPHDLGNMDPGSGT